MGVLGHFHNNRTRPRLVLRAVMALTTSFLLLTSSNVRAHGDKLEVTGFYEANFIRGEFLRQDDGFLNFDAALQGPFELTIGDAVRTGSYTWTSIARFSIHPPGSPDWVPGSAHGGAVGYSTME